MLKICGDTIGKPLELIFKQALTTGVFPYEWKKGNIVPCYKKGDKQNLGNYRPVSLLHIYGKFFERLIFNGMFSFFLTKNLLALNQSGFKPGDSCINQLPSIIHEIYSSFDDGFGVGSVFLDISKAFDKVWNEVIIIKVQQNGILYDLVNILSDFLKSREQRVTLNGQFSSWTYANAGVRQGSILGPLLFLIYFNDLPNGLSSNAKLFADDTSLFSVVHAKTLQKPLTILFNNFFLCLLRLLPYFLYVYYVLPVLHVSYLYVCFVNISAYIPTKIPTKLSNFFL